MRKCLSVVTALLVLACMLAGTAIADELISARGIVTGLSEDKVVVSVEGESISLSIADNAEVLGDLDDGAEIYVEWSDDTAIYIEVIEDKKN